MLKKITLTLMLLSWLAPSSWAASYAFPVPFNAKKHSVIYFRDLPSSGTIKIYTASGEKVSELNISPLENPKAWPVVNSVGEKVASGVYLYVIEGDGQKTVGKLVVIR
jgi:hypothetical protein